MHSPDICTTQQTYRTHEINKQDRDLDREALKELTYVRIDRGPIGSWLGTIGRGGRQVWTVRSRDLPKLHTLVELQRKRGW